MPATCRANSETAICIPRQMPRYGTPRSRANLAARILPSTPRMPKPPGIRMPSHSSSWRSASAVDRLGVDPAHLELRVVVDGRVLERLDHRQVCVLELDVLADEPDLHGALGGVGALDERLP